MPAESLEHYIQETCKFINNSPELISLLYDLDLLPEQLDKGSKDFRRMMIITEFFKSKKSCYCK